MSLDWEQIIREEQAQLGNTTGRGLIAKGLTGLSAYVEIKKYSSSPVRSKCSSYIYELLLQLSPEKTEYAPLLWRIIICSNLKGDIDTIAKIRVLCIAILSAMNLTRYNKKLLALSTDEKYPYSLRRAAKRAAKSRTMKYSEKRRRVRSNSLGTI